jgi:hypothetical protein
MSQFGHPFLAGFSEPPSSGPQMPELEVDASTGLLRRRCSSTPFVEELLADDPRCRFEASTATVITESRGDSPDPDLFRSDFRWAVSCAMATTLTRAQQDQPDPDLVRAG